VDDSLAATSYDINNSSKWHVLSAEEETENMTPRLPAPLRPPHHALTPHEEERLEAQLMILLEAHRRQVGSPQPLDPHYPSTISVFNKRL
jgi:hypothetical protein